MHKFKYFILLLLPIYSFATSSLSVQQSHLDPHILSQFMADIAEELEQNFDHQNDPRTRRDTREYGYSFFKMLNGDFSYSQPPQFLQKLGTYICRSLGHDPVDFTNIILSCYEEGFHLEPHVDVNEKDLYGKAPFYFSERVYGIIIEPDPTGHLYFVKWDHGLIPPLDLSPIYSLEESTGLVFCLEGDLRRSPYFHAVSPVSNKRISITFRTVVRLPENS
ncbi:MAG: hypothetical protein JSS10_02775 [Verrucomicrobia bacterium]|nr:hypothetical protein [Verrucomicrobiota bacterium]